jgi:K+-transporting ATPase KdpF subunit
VSDSRKADTMAVIYIVGGIVALGLLVYLTIALLKPEIFS